MEDAEGKLLVGLVGAALIVGAVWLGAESWRDYRAFGDAPIACDAATASDVSSKGRRWVTVEQAPWRCIDLVEGINGGVAFLPATASNGAVVVARFDHEIDCPRVSLGPLTGIIEPMDATRLAELRHGGLLLPGDPPLRTLEVCTDCGKGNARLGVIMCGLAVVLAFALYPLRLRWFAARQALHGAIRAAPREASHANRTVRIWGASTIGLGAVAAVIAGDWVAYGFIPVRLIAAVGIAIGIWMVVSPESYRRFAARAKRR